MKGVCVILLFVVKCMEDGYGMVKNIVLCKCSINFLLLVYVYIDFCREIFFIFFFYVGSGKCIFYLKLFCCLIVCVCMCGCLFVLFNFKIYL